MTYYNILKMLDMIDQPNRDGCLRLLSVNEHRFKSTPGSTNNHQAWDGGYYDHVQEIMNIGLVLYVQLNSLRPLPFSLSDVLLVTYLHDVEKPWKYERGEDGQLHHVEAMQTKAQQHAFREALLAQYGISLTPEQATAFKYVEGEFDDYSNRRRAMNPLGALCHLADVTSARIWFDHPFMKDDSWIGASRSITCVSNRK